MESADAVVVGAGVIGLSVAYHLANEGLSVILLEKEGIGTAASAAAVGAINLQSKLPDYYLELSMASAEYYPQFVSQLDGDTQYTLCGGITVMETEQEWKEKLAITEKQKAAVGFRIEILDAKEAREREPALSPHIKGAAYCPLEATVNPMFTCWAIARTAKKIGVKIRTYTPVCDICRAANGFRVTTTRDSYFVPRIVNCAGVDAKRLGEMVGVDIRVGPSRGQLIVTEPCPGLFRHYVSSLTQTKNGNVLIGATNELGVNSLSVTPDDLAKMAQKAIRLAPRLAQVSVVRTWAGVRPIPFDGLPLFGPVSNVEGFYVAVSHSGFVVGPILGKLMAELITIGRASLPTHHYAVERDGALN